MVQEKKKNTSSIHKTYCLGCKKCTNNNGFKKCKMTNKVLRQTTKCSVCVFV